MPILNQLIEDYRSILLAKNHLSKLEERIEVERLDLEELAALIDLEFDDVRQFEQLSLRGIFHKILGSKEEQYEIEKQEYLHAVLRYNECLKTLELLEFEEKVLAEKVAKEEKVRAQLDALIQERNYNLGKKYPTLRNLLLNIHEQQDESYAYKRELHDALIVGAKLQTIFKQMIAHLERAKEKANWGKFSTPSIGLEEKNADIDQAQQLSYQLKQLLQEFEDELEDIYAFKNIKRIGRIEEFQHFNGIYYDRLISDWIVQKKIVTALNCLLGTQVSVIRVVNTLKIQLVKTEKAIVYLEQRKKEVILEELTEKS